MARPDERRAVWILGSGFSRSLGGPLLTELLAPASRNDILSYFEGTRRGVDVRHDGRAHFDLAIFESVWRLYAYGREFREGTPPPEWARHFPLRGERLWSHAEDFLDIVDTAAAQPESPMRPRLEDVLARLNDGRHATGTLDQVAVAARRLMALECSMFLRRTDPRMERWEPYHAWARRLAATDVVVTFNYDWVVEKARPDVEVVLPGARGDGRAPSLLKLHGSLDWRWRAGGGLERVPFEDQAETCSDEALCIATPGPAKADHIDAMRSLWRAATDALRAADAVVFVGYCFPPSDAIARAELLGAVEDNRAARHLGLHVVLGPDLAGADVVRLGQMLRVVAGNAGRGEGRGFAVTAHPMFAEDFFSVFRRERLFTS